LFISSFDSSYERPSVNSDIVGIGLRTSFLSAEFEGSGLDSDSSYWKRSSGVQFSKWQSLSMSETESILMLSFMKCCALAGEKPFLVKNDSLLLTPLSFNRFLMLFLSIILSVLWFINGFI
jgi:hypothetical protein